MQDTGKSALCPLRGLLVALAAGFIAWALIGGCYPAFPMVSCPPFPSPEVQAAIAAANVKTACSNDAVALGLFGIVLGTSLAISEGVARRSLAAALAGTGVLILVGALFGGLSALLGNTLFRIYTSRDPGAAVIHALAIQGAILATLGGGIGLGLGVLTRRAGATAMHLVAGILAGALAGALYLVLASCFLPLADTQIVIPLEGASRLLWLELASGLIGLSQMLRPRRSATQPACRD